MTEDISPSIFWQTFADIVWAPLIALRCCSKLLLSSDSVTVMLMVSMLTPKYFTVCDGFR